MFLQGCHGIGKVSFLASKWQKDIFSGQKKKADFFSSNLQNYLIFKVFKVKNNKKSFKARIKLKKFPRNLQNSLVFKACKYK